MGSTIINMITVGIATQNHDICNNNLKIVHMTAQKSVIPIVIPKIEFLWFISLSKVVPFPIQHVPVGIRKGTCPLTSHKIYFESDIIKVRSVRRFTRSKADRL